MSERIYFQEFDAGGLPKVATRYCMTAVLDETGRTRLRLSSLDGDGDGVFQIRDKNFNVTCEVVTNGVVKPLTVKQAIRKVVDRDCGRDGRVARPIDHLTGRWLTGVKKTVADAVRQFVIESTNGTTVTVNFKEGDSAYVETDRVRVGSYKGAYKGWGIKASVFVITVDPVRYAAAVCKLGDTHVGMEAVLDLHETNEGGIYRICYSHPSGKRAVYDEGFVALDPDANESEARFIIANSPAGLRQKVRIQRMKREAQIADEEASRIAAEEKRCEDEERLREEEANRPLPDDDADAIEAMGI